MTFVAKNQIFQLARSANYLIVFRDLVTGLFFLVLPLLIAKIFLDVATPLSIVLVSLLSVWFGVWFHYLSCFYHEAAHDNLAPKQWNDFLANYLLGWMIGLDIKSYKISHSMHHRCLGTINDTEVSYFSPLNWKFLAESFLLLKVFNYFSSLFQPKYTTCLKSSTLKSRDYLALTRLGLFIFVSWVALWMQFNITYSLAWIVGLLSIFPGLSSLRQLLEHRPLIHRKSLNLSEIIDNPSDLSQPNLAITRNFGSSLFAKIIGSAGFNFHELHHMYPSISYTRFPSVIAFLKKSDRANDHGIPCISNYSKTFFNLFA